MGLLKGLNTTTILKYGGYQTQSQELFVLEHKFNKYQISQNILKSIQRSIENYCSWTPGH